MAVPKVNENLLKELEAIGFSTAKATRALHYSGNDSLEAAVIWIIDHENDPDIDQMPSVTSEIDKMPLVSSEIDKMPLVSSEIDKMPLVSSDIGQMPLVSSNIGQMPSEAVDINIESSESFQITEKMKIKAQELRDRLIKKEEKEKKLERKKEKERIRAGKEFLEAKRIAEENERRRVLAMRKAEKEEEKRAREKICWKLEQDKLERKTVSGMPPKKPVSLEFSYPIPVEQEKKDSLLIKSVTKAELLRECLRYLRRSHKDDDARVRRAFQTLVIYVRNVARYPDVEKFRKIRLSNPLFQERVARMKGGIEFLELCGFERIEGEQFLYLPRGKVDMALLNSAGSELKSAITNPFFGLLSREREDSD